MARHSRSSNAVSAELEEFRRKKCSTTSLGDGASLKRALDDSASQAVVGKGYEEDHSLSTIKIAVGLFTCALAGLAQLYPKKYPENFWLLLVCVALYVAATLALNIALGGTEGDLIFVSKNKGKGALCLASKLPRYSEQYTLAIGYKDNGWGKSFDRLRSNVAINITEFFTDEGVLLESKFALLIVRALQHIESKQNKGD